LVVSRKEWIILLDDGAEAAHESFSSTDARCATTMLID
jgi:hypothetical protein